MRIGCVTIGQSPRDDLVPELRLFLPAGTEVVECGALDGLDRDQVARLCRPEGEGDVLVTRLRDGSPVEVGHSRVWPRVQACVDRLSAQGVGVILVACTGEFGMLACPGVLVRPQAVLRGVVEAVAAESKLGVIVPAPEQVSATAARWAGAARTIVVKASCPYGEEADALAKTAASLAGQGVDVTVLDCMGFTLGAKAKVAAVTGKPVILARSMVARVLAEML